MRTVGQLSKLTGLSRRTVQYYAGEGDFKESANCCGVLVPCETDQNGCRKFDDDALFKLLAIKTLKWCGFEPRTIREIIESRGDDFNSLAAIQLDALEEKKSEIDGQIAFVRMLNMAAPVLGDGNESDEKAMSALTAMLLTYLKSSVNRALKRIDEDIAFGLDDPECLRYFEGAGRERELRWMKTADALVKEAGAGEGERALEFFRSFLEQSGNMGSGDEFAIVVNEVEVLFRAGVDPEAAMVQSQIDLFFRSAVPSGGLRESFLFASWVNELLKEADVAILLELLSGEGFADYVSRAIGSYRETIKKKANQNVNERRQHESKEVKDDGAV